MGSLGAFKIVSSLKRKQNFDIFGKVLVGIDFAKIFQKIVPRGVQEALERFFKNQ